MDCPQEMLAYPGGWFAARPVVLVLGHNGDVEACDDNAQALMASGYDAMRHRDWLSAVSRGEDHDRLRQAFGTALATGRQVVTKVTLSPKGEPMDSLVALRPFNNGQQVLWVSRAHGVAAESPEPYRATPEETFAELAPLALLGYVATTVAAGLGSSLIHATDHCKLAHERLASGALGARSLASLQDEFSRSVALVRLLQNVTHTGKFELATVDYTKVLSRAVCAYQELVPDIRVRVWPNLDIGPPLVWADADRLSHVFLCLLCAGAGPRLPDGDVRPIEVYPWLDAQCIRILFPPLQDGPARDTDRIPTPSLKGVSAAGNVVRLTLTVISRILQRMNGKLETASQGAGLQRVEVILRKVGTWGRETERTA